MVAEHPDGQSAASDPLMTARKALSAGRPATALTHLQSARKAAEASGEALSHDFELLRAVALFRGPDPEGGERLLREELAEGHRPAAAARELADHMAMRERLVDALAIIEAGLVRSPGRHDLQLSRARIQMDLYRYREALTGLRALIEQPVVASRARYELILTHRALGDYGTALEELNRLRSSAADWLYRVWQELSLLESELSQERAQQRRVGYTSREMLAILRGAPDVPLRLRAFRSFLRGAPSRAERALRIATNDPDPVVRIEVLRTVLAWSSSGYSRVDAGDWIARGLEDPAGEVRGVAARSARMLPPIEACDLLLDFLIREKDGYAFKEMHESLRVIHGGGPELPSGGQADPAMRRSVVELWRRGGWDK